MSPLKLIRRIPKTAVVYTVVLLCTAYLLLYRLDQVPVHLHQDELAFALNSQSVATTLHDFYGRLLPFYFQHLDTYWGTPVIVYTGAVFLKFLPLSETTVRLASVSVGLICILLMMLLTQRIFKSTKLTFLTGILAATTPVLFIHSRLLLDGVYPLPFIILWLMFLKKFLDQKKSVYLFFAALSLGIGIHSYHASKITMPLYFLATLIMLIPEIKKNTMNYALLAIGFLVPIAVAIPWFVQHPNSFIDLPNYSNVDPTINASQGILSIIRPSRLHTSASAYFAYFSPSFLFLIGDRSPIHSTAKAGAFLFPLLLLIIFGILEVIFNQKNRFAILVLFGFLTYPLAPVMINDPYRISRGLVVIPFAVMLATYGSVYLLRLKERSTQVLLGTLLLAGCIQFGFFLNDYFGAYRVRSYGWFNNNIGGALEMAINYSKNHPTSTIYIDHSIPFSKLYSHFYQIKQGQEITHIQRFIDPTALLPTNIAPESIVVTRAAQAHVLQERMNLQTIGTIKEPDGTTSFVVFYY